MFSKMVSERTTIKYALFNFIITLEKFKVVDRSSFNMSKYGDWNYIEKYLIKHGKYRKLEELIYGSSDLDD